MNARILIIFASVLGLLGLAVVRAEQEKSVLELIEPSAISNTEVTPYLFSIPAPRGRILDRNGVVLAGNQVATRFGLLLPEVEGETAGSFAREVLAQVGALPAELRSHVVSLSVEDLMRHFEHRRRLPVPLIEPLTKEQDGAAFATAEEMGLVARKVYLRHYPQGKTAVHLLGYLQKDGVYDHGPVAQKEPLFQAYQGAAGLEKTLEATLRGEEGLILETWTSAKGRTAVDLLQAPQPGHDVVLTLDWPTQRLLESALRRKGRSGSAVFTDAVSGEILASASYPEFDPRSFVPGINTTDFQKLVKDKRKPLYHRTTGAAYPPGSIFKVVPALAALTTGQLRADERIECFTRTEIGGRLFDNWSDDEEGWFDVRGALVRSHNSFFYQVAQRCHGRHLLQVARQLGAGRAPDLALEQVASGSLPSQLVGEQDRANYSIGQGDVALSPLQAARMMSSLATMRQPARPHIFMQKQDSETNRIFDRSYHRKSGRLSIRKSALHYVRNGLYGVVNHKFGTGALAYLPNIPVTGKTGTAQWINRGEEAYVGWFAGFVHNSSPPVAFAVAMEGAPHEKIFGGREAAPVAKQVLKGIFAKNSGSYVKAPAEGRRVRKLTRALRTANPSGIAKAEVVDLEQLAQERGY